jgi:hypothetical protein
MTTIVQTTNVSVSTGPIFSLQTGDYFYEIPGVSVATTDTAIFAGVIYDTGTSLTAEIHGSIFAAGYAIGGSSMYLDIASTGSVSGGIWGAYVPNAAGTDSTFEIDGALNGGQVALEAQTVGAGDTTKIHVGTSGSVTSQGIDFDIFDNANVVVDGVVSSAQTGFAVANNLQLTESATGRVSAESGVAIGYGGGSVEVSGSVSGGTFGLQATSTTLGTAITVASSGVVVGGASGISAAGAAGISVSGEVLGGSAWGIVAGIAGSSSEVDVFAGGAVKDGTLGGVLIHGYHVVSNAGTIGAPTAGAGGAAVQADGAGTLVNTGTMWGGASGVHYADTTAADQLFTINTGTIRSPSYSYNATGTNAIEHLVNQGTMTGNIVLGSHIGSSFVNAGIVNGAIFLGSGAGQLLDSTMGDIAGTVTCGIGGDTVVAAQNGGSVTGGTGNDILIGNATQAAADAAAITILDGGFGSNALYGGSAFTIFLAGDTGGGYNQIWGGASKMNGVPGFTNNTLSLSSSASGAFVDLLNGHDAYVASSGNSWTGSGTYEDSVYNVPNVIGSNFGDVIQADNGVDRIDGGGGADQLYAGSGAGSQDTFVYTAYGDSNLVTGYDTIVGFKIGTDKIDFSAFHTDASHLALSNAGTSNTVYLEQTPGSFNANTDLAMVVNTTATGGLHTSDFIF